MIESLFSKSAPNSAPGAELGSHFQQLAGLD